MLALSSCGGADGGTPVGDRDGEALSGPLTVFAAASLSNVFDRIGGDFRADHPGVDLRISYGPSSGLATAIVQGAPADVFASANQTQMDVVADAGLVAGEPAVVATNVLVIAVPPGNPGGLTSLTDFGREDLVLAVCEPEVPCGAAAEQVFAATGVTPRPDTYEQDVLAALNKVELGEVDAALVYATDVQSRGANVEGIPFPEAEEAVNEYPVAVLADAPNPRAAEEWVRVVRSHTAQNIFAQFGFRAPPG
jgi:molybdate transport system substrate-binding protein